MGEMSSRLRSTYVERCDERRVELARLQARVDRVSRARGLTAVAGLVLLILAWSDLVHPGWLLGPLVAFVALVVRHGRDYQALSRARRALAYYEKALRRLDGQWMGDGITHGDEVEPDHPYARDLDIFGRGSLFELLCTARTRTGQQTLARWLAGPATPAEVRSRHRAVEALRGNLDLREDLALSGDELEPEVDPGALIEWGRAPAALDATTARVAGWWAWGLAATNLLVLAAWALDLAPVWLIAVPFSATFIVGRRHREWVDAVEGTLHPARRELGLVAAVLRRLEQESFEDPRLVALVGTLVNEREAASEQIGRLERLAAWFETRHSQPIGPLVAFPLVWGVHFGLAVERWRAVNGPKIAAWFAALGELEALCAVSGYAYEHPEDPFPEILDDGPRIEGVALGHPLLPHDACVRNDCRLGVDVRALVVSGSNMSGKSTYLRTIGVNVVLALAGAPVRAERMRVSVLRVGASMRTEDSLQAGVSRFYAEIQRLQQIAEIDAPSRLFLLDEVLHGTNSHDRRIGAFAILRNFVDAGAIGLVTTHDLALAADTGTLGEQVRNVHFRDDVVEGRLHFDYRRREGVVASSNALTLMRSVGLPV